VRDDTDKHLDAYGLGIIIGIAVGVPAGVLLTLVVQRFL
jgi:hypothetical protein